VPKGVVAGAAEDGAALPVVVLVAHEAVGVLEVSAAAAVQVLGPLFAHRQVPLGGQAADETLGVFCAMGEGRGAIRGAQSRWGVGRCQTGGLRWEGNCRGVVGLRANRLVSLVMVSRRGAGMGWGERAAHRGERGWDCSGEGSVLGQLPVVRSSGESVCRASMISEKVPWGKKEKRQSTRRE